jgi:hypothetical protein
VPAAVIGKTLAGISVAPTDGPRSWRIQLRKVPDWSKSIISDGIVVEVSPAHCPTQHCPKVLESPCSFDWRATLDDRINASVHVATVEIS